MMSAISDQTLLDWTTRLRGGETGSKAEAIATHILRDFIMRTELDIPQSKVTLGWLAEALEAILLFEDARTAFCLPSRPNHRPRDVRRAIDVVRWIKLSTDRGYSPKEAAELAANVFDCDDRTIARYRESAKGWDEHMGLDAPWDEHFREKGRPLPEPQNAQDKK